MTKHKQDLSIAEAMRELIAVHGWAPSYQVVWKKIVAARLPAYKGPREWRIKRADLPEIARILRLDRAA